MSYLYWLRFIIIVGLKRLLGNNFFQSFIIESDLWRWLILSVSQYGTGIKLNWLLDCELVFKLKN